MHRRNRVAYGLAGLLVLAACQGSGQVAPPTGAVLPTVAGAPGMTFKNGAEARRAFTRASGSLIATLEDSAWLRFEGEPQTVAREHRAYFDYGYTTFDVEINHNEFVQPTSEVFILEDSCGARLTGKPTCYNGSPTLKNGKYVTTFSLSFQHVLHRGIQWIRLSWPRPQNGSSVEWRFEATPCPTPCDTPGPANPPAPCPPPCAPPPRVTPNR